MDCVVDCLVGIRIVAPVNLAHPDRQKMGEVGSWQRQNAYQPVPLATALLLRTPSPMRSEAEMP